MTILLVGDNCTNSWLMIRKDTENGQLARQVTRFERCPVHPPTTDGQAGKERHGLAKLATPGLAAPAPQGHLGTAKRHHVAGDLVDGPLSRQQAIACHFEANI